MGSCKTSMSLCAAVAMAMGMLAVRARALPIKEAISPRQAWQEVMVTNVQVRDGLISGKVMNKSSDTLRDVKLMIDHAWLWKNERHPGADNPSRTDFYVVPQPIPPHGTVAFEYQLRPLLPHRTDGRFNTIVKVIDFTEVGSQHASR